MKIEYTDYAEMKIIKRKLSKSQIEDALKTPDKILDGKFGRKVLESIF